MNKTIKVIPYKVGIMPDGSRASMFSAGLSRIEVTKKFTWQVTDHNGSVTTGMCRVPVDTKLEAIEIAHKVAQLRGYAVL